MLVCWVLRGEEGGPFGPSAAIRHRVRVVEVHTQPCVHVTTCTCMHVCVVHEHALNKQAVFKITLEPHTSILVICISYCFQDVLTSVHAHMHLFPSPRTRSCCHAFISERPATLLTNPTRLQLGLLSRSSFSLGIHLINSSPVHLRCLRAFELKPAQFC